MSRILVMILMWGWGQRYSHLDHAARLQQKRQAPVDCRSCHQLAPGTFQPLAVGRDDHKPCIDCHSGGEFARGNRCLTCHSSIRTMKPGRPWFPPFLKPGEFHVTFGHAKHVQMTAPKGDCGGCHGAFGGKAETGHVACSRCHANGTLPDINFCGGCHQGGAAPATEASEASAFRTGFSHQRHRQVSRAPCMSCHADLAGSDETERPAMKRCESCHDGKQAFDARGTHCGKCHKTDQHLSAVRSELPPFSHAGHRQRGVTVENCTACHGVGGDWRATLPGSSEHRPCQNESCHAAEFDGKIGARLCLSCHDRNDPFEPNPLKRPTSRTTPEWMVTMGHGPHLLQKSLTCNGCHPSIIDPIAAIPDGHALCGQCHLKKARPGMDACASCHAAVGAKPRGPWSVGARFRHDQNHRAACENCHRSPSSAPDLTTPPMAGCGQCHDGKQAFKVTGFGCAKCHATESRK